MRRLIPLLAVVASLAGAESAQALSCVPAAPLLARYQSAEVAVAATLVAARQVGPPLERRPGQPFIAGWGPTGPVIRARYRVLRVFKADARGPRVGEEFALTGRVAEGSLAPPWPRSVGFLLRRGRDGSLDGPLGTGACSPGPPTRTELRKAARLHRYGEGGGAASSTCLDDGATCASIKRDGREAILRLATYARGGDFVPVSLWDFAGRYDICVRAPDGSRTCKRFRWSVEPAGLIALRVRWSRHFPDRGRGVYRVRWLPPEYLANGYTVGELSRFLPSLAYRR